MTKRKGPIIPVSVITLSIITVLFFTGCGGGDDTTPANIAGKWTGPITLTYNGVTRSSSTEVFLTQDGNSVNGIDGGVPVSGVVDGNNVAYTGTRPGGWTFTWEMTANGGIMSGTVVVTGPFDGEMNGTEYVTRVSTGVQSEPVATTDLIDVVNELLKKTQQK